MGRILRRRRLSRFWMSGIIGLVRGRSRPLQAVHEAAMLPPCTWRSRRRRKGWLPPRVAPCRRRSRETPARPREGAAASGLGRDDVSQSPRVPANQGEERRDRRSVGPPTAPAEARGGGTKQQGSSALEVASDSARVHSQSARATARVRPGDLRIAHVTPGRRAFASGLPQGLERLRRRGHTGLGRETPICGAGESSPLPSLGVGSTTHSELCKRRSAGIAPPRPRIAAGLAGKSALPRPAGACGQLDWGRAVSCGRHRAGVGRRILGPVDATG